MEAVKTLPTSIKEKRKPRAKTPCILSTGGTKKKIGTRRASSNTKCLILLTRIERSLLKSASGASKAPDEAPGRA
eukprot:1136906-Pelagomonas_calceolata.AAC.1